MARRAVPHPTDTEFEILKVLWDSGPTTLGQVCSALRAQRPIATTTVATMLGIMRDKKLVKRARGPSGYVWSASLTQQTATRQVMNRLVDRIFDGSARDLVLHLLDSGELADRDVDAIRKMIEQYKASPQKRD